VTEQVLSFVLDACDRLMVIERGRIVDEQACASVDAERVKRMLAV
jgi:urea transport system ATP-binding protein